MTLSFDIRQNHDWQTEADWKIPDTPFMDFRFWQALRSTKALGAESGWQEYHIVIVASHRTSSASATDSTSSPVPIAVMPVFIKNHHRGEFVFDYAWAEAFARYGFDYYPRLVTAAPYSPITGERFWLAQGTQLTTDIITTALQGVQHLATKVTASSWHGLYFNQQTLKLASLSTPASHLVAKAPAVSTPPLLHRQGCQFQWFNQNISNGNQPFSDFDDFLSTLTAKKRKNIRQERKKIAKQQLRTRRLLGTEITAKDWEVFYQCYAMTYLIRGQRPYLHLEFFVQLGKTMPEHLMMSQAVNDSDEVVACALFLYDTPSPSSHASSQLSASPSSPDTETSHAMLYGRYWGALAEFDSLHFELCYYQGIEFAIEQGLHIFDPGTQGEHKLVRGFVPTVTHSIHQIYHEAFVEPIADFCHEERDYMAKYRQQALQSLPFNVDNMPNFTP